MRIPYLGRSIVITALVSGCGSSNGGGGTTNRNSERADGALTATDTRDADPAVEGGPGERPPQNLAPGDGPGVDQVMKNSDSCSGPADCPGGTCWQSPDGTKSCIKPVEQLVTDMCQAGADPLVCCTK